jgi:release factor glutamine methyltransferase
MDGVRMPILTNALQINKTYAKDALRLAVLELQRAEIASASLDARVLLQHVLGVSREQLLADDRLVITPQQEAAYQEMIAKRVKRQPVSQLVGRREFWGITFRVTGDTLDPRPDSETVIEAVLKKMKDREAPYRILDLGTGTGCLLLALLSEYPNATGVGVDISEQALEVAQQNMSLLGMVNRARFLRSRWADEVEGEFDIIVSNPPYIPTQIIPTLAAEVREYEPHLALDGGEDGFDCYRAIMRQVPKFLAAEGVAAFEVGIGQQRELTAIAEAEAMQVAGIKEDMAGIPRCVLVQHKR